MRDAAQTIECFGEGATDANLDEARMREIAAAALDRVRAGARVLAIVADKTRDDNTPQLLPMVAEILAGRGVAMFDALIAQGTHAPMTEAEKALKVGARPGAAGPGRIFDHQWDSPAELTEIGTLSADTVLRITNGEFGRDVKITVNRLVAGGNYDYILLFAATVPHEVVGFAGGAKYLFPGVGGPELTHVTHWVGALAGVENVIGRVETPPRHLLELAADLLRPEIICLNSVVTRDADDALRTAALFAGDFRAAFRRACEVSRHVHIKYTGRKYRRIIALLDDHYDDLWVGGKASYRLGGVIEEGGELIIYAPHLKSVSSTHGTMIEKYGYAPMPIVRGWVDASPELQQNLCVAAHLTQVAYAAGQCGPDGVLPTRYRITMATGLDRDTCARIKLGYADYTCFDLNSYRDDPDTLIVERAGRDLYLTEPFAEAKSDEQRPGATT